MIDDELHKKTMPLEKLQEYYNNVIKTMAASQPNDQDIMHLVKLYAFLESCPKDIHCFCDAKGNIYDCIPINNQPGWPKKTGPLPTAPDVTKMDTLKASIENKWRDILLPAPLADGQKKDIYGNLMACPKGTVPIRRIQVANNVKDNDKKNYKTEQNKPFGFFRVNKYRQLVERENSHRAYHLVAMAQQKINSNGGHSIINLWKPQVKGEEDDNNFSLSQAWYSAGFIDQNDISNLQTVECGWIVNPGLYNDDEAHLFIFYTPDGYENGAWDLTKENTFVQISPYIAPGMILSPSSVTSGQQYAFELTVLHDGERWWIYYNREAMGFYPDNLFNDGQLTKNATYVTFGGESSATEFDFSPMGSGRYAVEGWQLAAYQRMIGYFPVSNQDSPDVHPKIKSTNLKPLCGIVTTEDNPSETGIESIVFNQIESPNSISMQVNSDINHNGSELSIWYGGPGGKENPPK